MQQRLRRYFVTGLIVIAPISLTIFVLVWLFERLDPIESVRQAAERAGSEAGVLILLSHAGITANVQIARQIPEIDLIVSGGGKGYTPQPFTVDGGPPIVHADMARHCRRHRDVPLDARQPLIQSMFAVRFTVGETPLAWL